MPAAARSKSRPSSALRDAFVEDHRRLTQGLSNLVKLVEAGRIEYAVQLARELDEVAGPHIEFEESRFYPEVSRHGGRQYVERLYDEHRSGREALVALQALEGKRELDADQRDAILFHLRRAHEHALSCGTLLSHVTSLGPEEQSELLGELEACRRRKRRWTELESRQD